MRAIIVANQVPQPTGGGPHGLVRLIAHQMNSATARDDLTETVLVLEDRVVRWTDVVELSETRGLEPEIPVIARLRRAYGQYRTLSRLRRLHREVTIVQFEVPRASAVLRVLHPRSVRLTVSEHSRGGLDVEARAVGAKRLTIAKLRLSVWLSFAIADRIVWPSAGAIEEFHLTHRHRPWVERKYVVVHNGVNMQKRDPPSMSITNGDARSAPRLVIVASDVPDKNVRGLLEILDAAVASRSSGRIAVDWLGGPLEADFSRCSNLIVQSWGVVSSDVVKQVMRRSVAFVAFPKRTIFDLAVLEAMSESLPVICPPFGGFIEALGADYPLYFRDADELAAALARLEDPRFRSEVGASLHARASSLFTPERMLRGYVRAI